MDDPVIMCDEVIELYHEEIKTILRNFNEKNMTYKTQFLYFTYVYICIKHD